MRVIFNLDRKHNLERPVAIALGTFDGLHLGHQMLMQQLKLVRHSTGCATLVYTFLNNPIEQLAPQKAPSRIMTIPEKISRFNNFDIDFLVLNTFDTDLATVQPNQFIEDVLLKNYNVKYIVVGYDFRFGYQGRGDTDLLEKLASKFGFKLIVIPPLSLGDQIISSSLIRELIQEGDMDSVSMYLGGYYSICGRVVHGFGRGRELGFPTANLLFDTRKSIPKHGIYLTKVYLEDHCYWGMTNVGINPTFNDEGLFIETYILDFNEDLYDTKLRVEFLKRIRDEIKFDNVEGLKEQIAKDIQWAKNYIYKFK